tara:strand:+ start:115 stop:375 length:261 start_codon:yes stop_codon:yes gene_type:complete
MGQEIKIRPGSLIIENSYIFSNPSDRHPIKSYGIVLSTDKALGIEIFWLDDNQSDFYSISTVEWFLDDTATKCSDGPTVKFWTICY